MNRAQEIAWAGGLTVFNERTGRDATAHLRITRTNRYGSRSCRSCDHEFSQGERYWYVTAFFTYELCLDCGPSVPVREATA